MRGKGSKPRPIKLSPHSLRHLLSYLDQHRLKEKRLEGKRAGEEPLFLSETGRPLTTNAITLLFARLNKRAGITGKCVSPSWLRETFAERSLQAGDDPCTVQELLRHTDLATATRSQHLSEQVLDEHKRKETPGDLLP